MTLVRGCRIFRGRKSRLRLLVALLLPLVGPVGCADDDGAVKPGAETDEDGRLVVSLQTQSRFVGGRYRVRVGEGYVRKTISLYGGADVVVDPDVRIENVWIVVGTGSHLTFSAGSEVGIRKFQVTGAVSFIGRMDSPIHLFGDGGLELQTEESNLEFIHCFFDEPTDLEMDNGALSIHATTFLGRSTVDVDGTVVVIDSLEVGSDAGSRDDDSWNLTRCEVTAANIEMAGGEFRTLYSRSVLEDSRFLGSNLVLYGGRTEVERVGASRSVHLGGDAVVRDCAFGPPADGSSEPGGASVTVSGRVSLLDSSFDGSSWTCQNGSELRATRCTLTLRGNRLSVSDGAICQFANCVVDQRTVGDDVHPSLESTGTASFSNGIIAGNIKVYGAWSFENSVLWFTTREPVFEFNPSFNFCNLDAKWDLAVAGASLINHYGLSADPRFVSDESWQLLPDSPCLDRGNPRPEYSDPDGSRNDIGVHGGPMSVRPRRAYPPTPMPAPPSLR